ncbi:mitochondrial glyco protein [Dissoconium aciculare CBS 342.82]|uniref:Mitochondrial glyco protein n=1 Tax=Dissoconium aciculare CBS 342.82 TaxID=1314786 RepID=A0A6J3MB74_9PEZI|nr:mitochondrial glyco protein [Dissoconium aciculare CBS 342.82]KAF1825108.1 mitochondrial glyco protein [Dissoconium aciculare CBS 342.82]
MLSLRAFARVAPRRISSRISTSSSLLRPTFQSAVRNNGVSIIGRAATASFSTSRQLLDQYSQHLAAKLANEIELEQEEAAEGAASDDGVKQFVAENPEWTILDAEGEQDVFLQRKFEDEEVTAHFSISDFNNPMQDEMAMEDDILGDEEDLEGQSGGANTAGSSIQGRAGGGNLKVGTEDNNAPADRDVLQDEEDRQTSFPVNVTVLIRKAGKGSLRFDLVAENGMFLIQQITPVSESSASAVEQIREALSQRSNQYSGPPFEQLDEDLQSMLDDYLGVRGISSNLANLVPDYVDVKEQKEYLGWLSRVKNFVD